MGEDRIAHIYNFEQVRSHLFSNDNQQDGRGGIMRPPTGKSGVFQRRIGKAGTAI
jgi:hypothetical protein